MPTWAPREGQRARGPDLGGCGTVDGGLTLTAQASLPEAWRPSARDSWRLCRWNPPRVSTVRSLPRGEWAGRAPSPGFGAPLAGSHAAVAKEVLTSGAGQQPLCPGGETFVPGGGQAPVCNGWLRAWEVPRRVRSVSVPKGTGWCLPLSREGNKTRGPEQSLRLPTGAALGSSLGP